MNYPRWTGILTITQHLFKMKHIKFWQDKFQEVYRDFMGHRSYYLTYKSRARYDRGIKLRKMWGHSLNRDYDGYKIYHRRKKWLKNRLMLITLAAQHRREMIRLARTKLSFFETRIKTLGGKVDTWQDWRSCLNETNR